MFTLCRLLYKYTALCLILIQSAGGTPKVLGIYLNVGAKDMGYKCICRFRLMTLTDVEAVGGEGPENVAQRLRSCIPSSNAQVSVLFLASEKKNFFFLSAREEEGLLTWLMGKYYSRLLWEYYT